MVRWWRWAIVESWKRRMQVVVLLVHVWFICAGALSVRTRHWPLELCVCVCVCVSNLIRFQLLRLARICLCRQSQSTWLHLQVASSASPPSSTLVTNGTWKRPVMFRMTRNKEEASLLPELHLIELWFVVFNAEIANRKRRERRPLICPFRLSV